MAAAIGSIAAPTQAAQVVQRFEQAEQRAPAPPGTLGKLLVEESTIDVVTCNGPGENKGQFYIYQYHKRAPGTPGFRAILPPYWAQAIGGQDWPTYQQAVAIACGGGWAPRPATPAVPSPAAPAMPAAPAVNVSGQWRLVTNCKWSNPAPWQATLILNQAADGSLTASTANDPLNTTLMPPNSYGSTMKSQVIGSQFNLLLHPNGWASVLEFTGTVAGSMIQGQIHHYTHDDCAFAMSRLS